MRDKNLVAPCYKRNKEFRIFVLLALSFFFFFLAKKVVIDNMIPFFRPPDPPLLHYFGQDISRPGIVHLYLQASCTFFSFVWSICFLPFINPDAGLIWTTMIFIFKFYWEKQTSFDGGFFSAFAITTKKREFSLIQNFQSLYRKI